MCASFLFLFSTTLPFRFLGPPPRPHPPDSLRDWGRSDFVAPAPQARALLEQLQGASYLLLYVPTHPLGACAACPNEDFNGNILQRHWEDQHPPPPGASPFSQPPSGRPNLPSKSTPSVLSPWDVLNSEARLVVGCPECRLTLAGARIVSRQISRCSLGAGSAMAKTFRGRRFLREWPNRHECIDLVI